MDPAPRAGGEASLSVQFGCQAGLGLTGLGGDTAQGPVGDLATT